MVQIRLSTTVLAWESISFLLKTVNSHFDTLDSCRVEALRIDDMCAAMAQRLDVKLKRRTSHSNMPVIVC
jgi:hypothetical protein